VFGVQVGTDSEPGGGGRGANQVEGLGVVGERLGRPILGDLAEEAAFDGVVLGGPGGIVGHGDGESQLVTEKPLELVLPGAPRGGVAAAGIGQDQQVLGVGVAPVSFPTPPAGDGSDGKGGGLVTDADEHRTAVSLEIINAVGEGDALGERAKVMVVDRGGDALPLPTGILKVTDQFPLFSIDTDDGVALTAETRSQSGNVMELLVADGTVPRRDLFAIQAEGEMELVEQAGDGAGADPDTQALELAGDLGRGLVGPSPAARRIARGIVFQQPFDLSDYLGRFFPRACAPRPFCGRGLVRRPGLTTVAVRGRQCGDGGRGNRPTDDPRPGPA